MSSFEPKINPRQIISTAGFFWRIRRRGCIPVRGYAHGQQQEGLITVLGDFLLLLLLKSQVLRVPGGPGAPAASEEGEQAGEEGGVRRGAKRRRFTQKKKEKERRHKKNPPPCNQSSCWSHFYHPVLAPVFSPGRVYTGGRGVGGGSHSGIWLPCSRCFHRLEERVRGMRALSLSLSLHAGDPSGALTRSRSLLAFFSASPPARTAAVTSARALPNCGERLGHARSSGYFKLLSN